MLICLGTLRLCLHINVEKNSYLMREIPKKKTVKYIRN